jgi:PadR family transcriptional regulator, regulatory protein PadR
VLRDVYLGFVRLHLLHHASEAPIYGLDMIRELDRHGYKLSAGTLYPILHGMERSGLLVSKSEGAGRNRRRLYRATDLGLAGLEEARRRAQELVDEIAPRNQGG